MRSAILSLTSEKESKRMVFFMVFFGCLGFCFCSLRRGLAIVAIFGGVWRFSAGGRLLPLWLSLCFLLRRVGLIIALRVSSPIFLPFFIDVWGVFIDVWGVFIDIEFCFFLHISDFFVTLQYSYKVSIMFDQDLYQDDFLEAMDSLVEGLSGSLFRVSDDCVLDRQVL